MKRLFLLLLTALLLLSSSAAYAESDTFVQRDMLRIIPSRAFDGLMEESLPSLPEISGGIWSASMSQPAITATLPDYSGRVTYEVVYSLRTGTTVHVPRLLKNKEWTADVLPHVLRPMDASSGRWITETAEYVPYSPYNGEGFAVSAGGKTEQIYFTSEVTEEWGESEWDELTCETPLTVVVTYVFNVPASYDGLLLAINPREVTRPSAEPAEEETAEAEVPPQPAAFDDVPNLKDWVFIRLSDSCFYETIEPSTWGDNVNFLQQILIRAGYQKAGTADGSYGPTTEKAVTDFQNDHGLPPTGVADNYTIHAILKAARGE